MAERPMYPGNSFSDREDETSTAEPRKVETVVQGKVREKKGLGRKIFQTFIVEDLGTITDHIVKDILIPEIQKSIVDIVRSSVEMMFGQSSTPRSARERGPEYVSYSKYSVPQSRHRERPEPQKRRSTLVEDVVLATRVDAEDALDCMYDILNAYNTVSVADYYKIVGVKSDYTEEDYGWTNLRGAHIMKVADGYVLNLPKPVMIAN